MSTKHYYFTGTVKWAKVRKPDEKYNDYKINLYPDKESLNLIKESGVQVEPKEDEDGTFYTFRRKNTQLIKNKVEEFGAPKVLNADNTEYDGLVGNGSKITAKVAVFDTMKGKGHRLEVVRVEELVPYEPEGSTGGSFSMPPPIAAAPKTRSQIKPPF